jgi:hypothetical protein
VVAHVVLYQPRPDLSPEERDELERALHAAVREIPSIRRVIIGERIHLGTAYESLMRTDYTYLATFEFDDEAGLRAYLEHPAPQQLGALFYTCSTAALAYDYAVHSPRP